MMVMMNFDSLLRDHLDGLGRCRAVDVTVEFHPSGLLVERKGVPADGTVEIAE